MYNWRPAQKFSCTFVLDYFSKVCPIGGCIRKVVCCAKQKFISSVSKVSEINVTQQFLTQGHSMGQCSWNFGVTEST